MPISPKDYELYSRMTGTPMPKTASERMIMGPQVYDFARNFNRKPNIVQRAGNFIGDATKTLGAAMGNQVLFEQDLANQVAKERALQEFKPKTEDVGEVVGVMEAAPTTAAERVEKMKMDRVQEQARLKKEDKDQTLANTMAILQAKSLAKGQSEDSQLTPSENYNQEEIQNQTGQGVIDQAGEKGALIGTTTTVAEILATNQSSAPAFTDELQTAENVLKGEGPVGTELSKSKLDSFVATDPALKTAIEQRNLPDDRFGHPDIPPGEESTAPSFAPTQDSVNKMAIDKAVNMGEQSMGNYGDMSPNESAGKTNQLAETLVGLAKEPYSPKEVQSAKERLELKTAIKQKKSGINSRFTEKFFGAEADDLQSTLNKALANFSPEQRLGIIAQMQEAKETGKSADQSNLGPKIEVDPVEIPTVSNKTDTFLNTPQTFTIVNEDKSLTTMPKSSSFVKSMTMNPPSGENPNRVTFELDNSSKPFSFDMSGPMAVSLGEMADDGSLKDESYGKLFNLAKKSAKEGTGMFFNPN